MSKNSDENLNTIAITYGPGYYGLSMVSVEMGTNSIVSGILAAMIEIPSYVFVVLFTDNFGRKPILLITLLLTGATCIPSAYTEGHLQSALALAGTTWDLYFITLREQSNMAVFGPGTTNGVPLDQS